MEAVVVTVVHVCFLHTLSALHLPAVISLCVLIIGCPTEHKGGWGVLLLCSPLQL
jgi:hypothetical protein